MLIGDGMPAGVALPDVGDTVFLKSRRCGWLHGTVICLYSTCLGLAGPGIAGIRRIEYQDIAEVQINAPAGEMYNQCCCTERRHKSGR